MIVKRHLLVQEAGGKAEAVGGWEGGGRWGVFLLIQRAHAAYETRFPARVAQIGQDRFKAQIPQARTFVGGGWGGEGEWGVEIFDLLSRKVEESPLGMF